MKQAIGRAIAAVVVAASCPTGAFAQSDARPPVTDAAGGRQAAGGQKVNLTIDLDEAYDQNVVVKVGNYDLSLFQGSGFYTMVSPAFDYASGGQNLQVAITAGSNVRYYNETNQTLVTNHSVGAGLTWKLSPSTSLMVNQGFAYAPALLYGLFATGASPVIGESVPAASNYALNTQRSYAANSTAGLTRQISRRAAAVITANYRLIDFVGTSATYPDLHSYDAGGRVTYSLSRSTGMKVGYTFRQAQYSNTPVTTEHNFDIGIDYSRLLSQTRRTVFSFAVGPTIADGSPLNGSSEILRQYRVIADASVRHPVGRTWNIVGNYHRGLGYIEGFQSPVYTAAYNASAGGYLTKRTDLMMSAAYSTGESALTGAASQFTSYTGDVRLNFAVNRTWTTYVEYLLYRYDFNQSFPLPLGVPPALTRNGVRTGVVLRMPARKR